MRHQEKKYLVESFEVIQANLKRAGAAPGETSTSTHYYAQQAGSAVTKLVMHGNAGGAIHVLDEEDGKFTLKENIPVTSKEAGLNWLRARGFDRVSQVVMAHTDYEYKKGLVGLYVINDSLHSVILDYPEGQHDAIASEFGLASNEVIALPYNKYLEQLGKLKTLSLK